MRRTEYALGAVVSLEAHPGSRQMARALQRAGDRLHRADEVFSLWKPDSAMSRIRREELCLAQAPPEVAEVLGRCAEARRLSEGWYDPWAAVGGVDPTALATGWAVGQALGVLRTAGAQQALVTAGSTAAALGTAGDGRPWRVPLGRDPRVAVQLHGPTVGAVATVSEGPCSATVVGPDPGLVRALATALLAAGDDGLALMAGLSGHGALLADGHGHHRTAGRITVLDRRLVTRSAALSAV